MKHNKEQKADCGSISNGIAKPHVGCCTSMSELIQWCILNAFNIEGQDGTKYVAIDYEEMQSQLDYFVEKEKQQIIEAYTKGQMGLAEIFADYANNRLINKVLGHKVEVPEDNEDGEEYYSQTYGSVA